MKQNFRSIFSYACLVSCLVLFTGRNAFAGEGMWLPSQVDLYINKMKDAGCKLSASDIYNINNGSLKDAVVQFANYCTGELVSSQGLLFTNHHCGYESIAELSTAGTGNYLDKGYWAHTAEQEIPVPGLTISRLVSVDDVTNRVLNAPDADEEIAKIETEYAEATGMKAEVKAMFYGLEYYVMIYEVFRDVRFVGAPPSSIGAYGGDTDNWMWPRHTGDFSIFRVYSDENNKPADYSPSNKPYKPLRHLKINLKGINNGDFAMIMGYPGSTTRYLTTSDVDKIAKEDYPVKTKILDEILRLMEESMDKDESVRISMAATYAQLANSSKYFEGLVNAMKTSQCNDAKTGLQADFMDWVSADESRKKKYGSVIEDIDNIVRGSYDLQKMENYLFYGFFSVGFIGFAYDFAELEALLAAKQNNEANLAAAMLLTNLEAYFAERDLASEEKILASVLRMADEDLIADYKPSIYTHKTYLKAKPAAGQNQYEAFASLVFDKSLFTDQTKMKNFLNKPNLKTLQADPGWIAFKSVLEMYFLYAQESKAKTSGLDALQKTYMEGIKEFKKNEYLYPDANFSLRLTYGHVKPYEPRDGVSYDWYTTHRGILEKYVPGDKEFDVDPKLLGLLEKKDFGKYGKNGELPVCFVADLDITGGNSGSPVIDANGDLIGIAFDGVWEGMVGDLYFDESSNRTISVDIRYVLFIIDKYGECKRIMDELETI